MSKTVLMLATFGLEVIEVGGTLALHAQAGDSVHVAVLQTREKTHPQIEQAARMLGAKSVFFFDVRYGNVEVDLAFKMRLVRLFREIKPDILITQDPEHSAHDLDPDRRLAMLIYLEAVAIAGARLAHRRVWWIRAALDSPSLLYDAGESQLRRRNREHVRAQATSVGITQLSIGIQREGDERTNGGIGLA